MNDRVSQLVENLRALLAKPPHSFEPSFDSVAATDEYRELVEIGDVPALCHYLKAGDLFLTRAILEISGLRLEDLGLEGFPSEQDIGKALLDLASMDIVWTAVSYTPQVLPVLTMGGETKSQLSFVPVKKSLHASALLKNMSRREFPVREVP